MTHGVDFIMSSCIVQYVSLGDGIHYYILPAFARYSRWYYVLLVNHYSSGVGIIADRYKNVVGINQKNNTQQLSTIDYPGHLSHLAQETHPFW